jgi:DNA-binding transcriptional MerR regulator
MENEKTPTVGPERASQLSGIMPHMLTYLARIDVLKPSGGPGGRGRPRQFTFNDVVFLKAIANLLAKGIEVKNLGRALQRAKADADSWMDIRTAPGRFLVTDGTEVFLSKAGQLESKTFNGQLAFGFVIDLRETHKYIAKVWCDKSQVA